MTFPYSNETETPQPYRFSLKSKYPLLRLTTPPVGWESGSYELTRDIENGGVTQMFNAESLTFIKEGAFLLITLFNESFINAKCSLIIEWFNVQTLSYVSYPTEYDFQFKTLKTGRSGEFNFGVDITVEKSNILTKIDSRSGLDVDLAKMTSIDTSFSINGSHLVPYTNLKNLVKFPVIYSYLNATYSSEGGTIVDSLIAQSLTLDNLTSNDFTETQLQDDQTNTGADGGFFFHATEARDLIIQGSMELLYTSFDPLVTNLIATVKAFIYDETDTLSSSIDLGSVELTQDNDRKTIDLSGTISLLEGYSCNIVYNLSTNLTITVTQEETFFRFQDQIIQTSSTSRFSFPYYEALESCLMNITDRQWPLYSEKYGRIDTPYNFSGNKYSSENQDALGVFITGLSVRGAGFDTPSNEYLNNPYAMSFDQIIKTFKSQSNIGYGIENIEGEDRVRVEDYAYFFQDTVILDLSDRISTLDISTEVASDLCYISLESGGDSFDYEAVNGRGEYNTTSQRTTVLNADNTFDNISSVREDTRGITLNLEEDLSTTDEKSDNDMFAVKVQRGALDWDAETDENVEVLDDTSLFREGSLNLFWTPTRKLIRSMQRWSGCLINFLSAKITFQTSEKLQTLKTSGEGYEITENDDLSLVADYSQDPIFKPIKHTFEVELTWEDIVDIQTNIYGLIKATDELSGWIVSLSKPNDQNKATITILEKYTA